MKKIITTIASLCCAALLSAQTAALDAPNLDFSMNNFTGWKRTLGTFVCDDANVQDPHKTYSYDWTETIGEIAENNRIDFLGDVNTLDPILQCDALYTNPDPGKNVARIGRPLMTEGMVGEAGNLRYPKAAAEKLEYDYQITPATSVLKYRFASVLHIPDEGGQHVGVERPFFSVHIKVVKPDGTLIIPACSSYETVVNDDETSTLERATSPCRASASTTPGEYMYQPWTSVLVDLRNYVGSRVYITVIVHDCLVRIDGKPVAGGHEAYGYFRAEAMDLSLTAKACKGEDAQIVAPAGFASYRWSRSDNFPITSDPAHPNIVTIPAEEIRPDVEYSCVVSDELGCAAIELKTKLTLVDVAPSFTYTTDCAGKVNFTSTSTVQDDVIVGWLWDTGEAQLAGEDITHSFQTYGQHDVTLTTTTKNGCVKSATIPVTVPYFPDLVIEGTPEMCKGDELQLKVKNVESGSRVTWSSSVAGQTFPESSLLVTTPTEPQTYTVTVTDVRGCTYQNGLTVSLFDKDPIRILGDDKVCPNKDVALTLDGTGWSEITWNVPHADGSTNVVVTPSVPSTYRVDAKDSHGCKVFATHNIDVYEVPTLSVDVPAVVCKGSDAVIKVTGAQGYEWVHDELTQFAGNEVVLHNVQQNQNFNVLGFNEHGCYNSALVSFRVADIPVVTVDGATERCFDSEPFELLAHGAESYVWNGTTEGATFTAPSDRNHRVTLVGSIENCESEPVVVDLKTLETPTISAVVPAASICEGEEVTLQVTGADNYLWTNTTETMGSIVVSPIDNKVYSVRGVSADGCLSNIIEIPVTVYHPDQVKLHIVKEVACPNKPDSVVLVADGALTYQWSTVPAIEGIEYHRSDRLDVLYDEPVLITVKGTNEFACSSTAQIALNRLPVPEFAFQVTPTWVEAGNSHVHVTGLQPSTNMKWYWDMGDGTDVLQTADTVYTYNVDNFSEPFMLSVTAVDEYGCIYQGESEVKIWKEIWAPNAFTPNGDGLNDVFQFYGTQYLSTLDYYIYNRLGEVVFEGKSPTDSWDGTYQGKPCPWGVYGWVAHYTATVNDAVREVTLKGQVSIVK